MNSISYWGISADVVKKFFKDQVRYNHDTSVVSCGYLTLRNLHSDCGAVTMANISNADTDDLKNAIEYCRLSGYSLLVGTVTETGLACRLENLGFVCKHLGPSHRNPKRPHYLVSYHIPEDKFQVKGYTCTGVVK